MSAPSHFEILTKQEREEKLRELGILDHELSCLKSNSRVYQKFGNTDVLFLVNRSKAHSDTKLQIQNFTQSNKKLELNKQ